MTPSIIVFIVWEYLYLGKKNGLDSLFLSFFFFSYLLAPFFFFLRQTIDGGGVEDVIVDMDRGTGESLKIERAGWYYLLYLRTVDGEMDRSHTGSMPTLRALE